MGAPEYRSGAHLLRTTRQRLTQRPPNACPLRRAGMSVGSCSPTVCGRRACRSSRGPCSDAGNNPCRRQGDRVVAPRSTGAGCWLRTTMPPPAAPISSSPMAWRRRRRPIVLSPGAHARMGVPVGRGPLGDAEDHQETVDPRLGLRPLSPAVAVIRTRPDGALACRRQQAHRRTLGHSHSHEAVAQTGCRPRGLRRSGDGAELHRV
jgi:hypothetical protein